MVLWKGSIHLSATKRVFQYLKSFVDHGLFFFKGPLHLTAYCDSDWARSPDDHRSTSGFAIFLGSNLISWSAKKQVIVSCSSPEAKYRSLAITTAEVFFIWMFFQEIRIPLFTIPTRGGYRGNRWR